MKWLSSSYWTPAFVSYHDPGAIFNLDISGGLPAVASYMLVQSTKDTIELLPSLAVDWPNGEINGVLARGGFEIDMIWKNYVPESVNIKSLCGNKTTLVFNGSSCVINLKKGVTEEITEF